jgi:acetyl/propionyl-CoA carboxylase alpha subunit/acetyl-CoA carboxylase carboxyltransferase component
MLLPAATGHDRLGFGASYPRLVDSSSLPARVLVANRGEIAVRVLRTCADLGIGSVAVAPADDADSMAMRMADERVVLPGVGVAAYLDGAAIIAAARSAGADAIHPGYGFLAESPQFAADVIAAGIAWVGPSVEALELLGNKISARDLARSLDVPVAPATVVDVSVNDAKAFVALHGAAMVKAVAGGGGRGMRVVHSAAGVAEAIERASSEARTAFGNGSVYLEALFEAARHVEVQIIGDGDRVVAIGDRECTIQRRHQKLIEFAPSPFITEAQRTALFAAAERIGVAVGYRGVGTVEFLVRSDAFVFIEVNPRLQVEHTVTEMVTGTDLVALQLALAMGAAVQLDRPQVVGFAVQARVNAERTSPDGSTTSTAGPVVVFEPPSGPYVRVDTFGTSGMVVSPRYDPLLGKVITWGDSFQQACQRSVRALHSFRIEGVGTNLAMLGAVLRHDDVLRGDIHTTWFGSHASELVGPSDHDDPTTGDEVTVRSPMIGTISSIDVVVGESVRAGQTVAILEAMKMEHVLSAGVSGVVTSVFVAVGDTVEPGAIVVLLVADDVSVPDADAPSVVDLDHTRADLSDVNDRQFRTTDSARPDAVARRRATGQRTARENVDDLLDTGSYVEYGSLVLAAQRRRRSVDDLIAKTPADGMVAGLGRVNGDLFADDASRCVVMSYDYTVLAGTQGQQNHRKKDRLFELAERHRLPVVFFTEGGGGRPGDTDGLGVAGLDCMAFHLWGRLSGLVPLVGINSGYCFAGNAAILGCCDVVIATENSNIGMGGPAMIEGGGLGVFHPKQVGPIEVQRANGVIDIVVADEPAAVEAARKYLAYFQGATTDWTCADQRLLRSVIPENRLRIYDIRTVIDVLADTDSVLELRRDFGPGMITALIRIEGRPMGLIANNPAHLAGAIDSNGADKAARFLQLCDAFDLPILSLCDTPGMMVGPDVEATALVRHCSRLFVTGGSLTVPFFTIVLRKGYGLGAQAMAGGSFKAPVFTVAWPTGEFGGMGLEGAVKLGFRDELAAISEPAERRMAYEERVARMYEHGKAINMASHFEIDDVIDPADSRVVVANALRAMPAPPARVGKKRPMVDTW